MRPLIALLALLPLTACTRAQEAPKPTPTAAETFKGCTWEKVTGPVLSIWSFNCPAAHIRLAPSGDGFALVSDDPTTPKPTVVIRVFNKERDAPYDSILPAVRAASPGPVTARCELVPVKAMDDMKGRLFQLSPVGADKIAYDKANEAEPGGPPCGELGIGPVGDRVFVELSNDPTKLIWVDLGSEIQIFDPNTLASIRK